MAPQNSVSTIEKKLWAHQQSNNRGVHERLPISIEWNLKKINRKKTCAWKCASICALLTNSHWKSINNSTNNKLNWTLNKNNFLIFLLKILLWPNIKTTVMLLCGMHIVPRSYSKLLFYHCLTTGAWICLFLTISHLCRPWRVFSLIAGSWTHRPWSQ